MKYTLYIDYKATVKPFAFEYITMDATNELDAIAEADARWSEDVYLMQIMQKDGNVERREGCRVTTYTAVLARRSYGWHMNDKANSEGPHDVRHWIPKNPKYAWFENCTNFDA